jgi:AraC family transcriptional regulator
MQAIPHPTASSYRTRLARVRSHVYEHYAEEMNMADLARLTGFSKSHFQRLFHETFGETLREYIKRIRLEKSACKLMSVGGMSVTDVAYDCGFSSSQSFTRAFKAHYGIVPTFVQSDINRGLIFEKKWQNMKTHYGEKYLLPREVRPDGSFIHIPFWNGEGKDFQQDLEVVDMPPLRVACVRTLACPGSAELFEAMNHLVAWAMPRGLFMGNFQHLRAIRAFTDKKGRYTVDMAISVPDGVDAEEGSSVRIRYLPAGEYGVYHAEFSSVTKILETWKQLAIGWWISSYSLRDLRPRYELYYNNPDMQKSWSLTADLCLPITTLRNQ